MAYDINSALERLEQNLKDIDSARKQVSSVVTSSKELQAVVQSYVTSLNAVREEISAWGRELEKQSKQISLEYVESIQRLNTSCTKIVDSFKTSIDTAAKTFVDEIQQPLSDFNKENKAFATSITQLTVLYSDFKAATAAVMSLKDVLTQISKDLKESQEEQDKVLEELKRKVGQVEECIKTRTESIQNLCATINSVVTTVNTSVTALNTEADNISTKIIETQKKLEDTQKATESKIELLQTELSKAVNVNRWLIIGGIVIMIVLHFV